MALPSGDHRRRPAPQLCSCSAPSPASSVASEQLCLRLPRRCLPEQSAASFCCGLVGWPGPRQQELQTSLREVFPSCGAKNERTLERTLYLSISFLSFLANLPLLPDVFPHLPPPCAPCTPHPPFSHLLREAFPAPTPGTRALWLCHKYIYNQV